jgi:N-acetyl-gamma-glutamyl-phosphate reductase
MHTAPATRNQAPRPTAARREQGADAAATRVAVAGATGYTGQELLRLLARHPDVTIVAATASAGGTARTLPALRHIWDGTLTPLDVETLAAQADLVFLALPDTAAAEIAPRLLAAGVRAIDLSGAFRLHDERSRGRWYPETHRLPDALAYGLTEYHRDLVRNARLVANPGCYPTASVLAIKPLVDAGLILASSDIVIDAKSGVSGAGKTPSERTHFSEVHGSLSAYGVFGHRHGAEIEEGVGRQVTFTPHLVPLDRGIFSTIYVRVAPGTTDEALADAYERVYGSEPFIRLTGNALPEIKHVAHTNFCDIGWRVDASGRAILISVIDNLVKGASGQAVQNMNVMIGAQETTSLL